jgi:hypothetical protein
MNKKKNGQQKAESISAVKFLFGEESFEDVEDTPKQPRMQRVRYVSKLLPAPKKVDYCNDWNNTEKVLDRYFKETRAKETQERCTTATNGDDG